MILYLQQVNKYKYLSDVEGQLDLIKTIETFKGHLATGRTGNAIRKREETHRMAEANRAFSHYRW